MLSCTSHLSYAGHVGRKIMIQGSLGESIRPIRKITKAKKFGGKAQVV
jgi:hypothetical protein